VSHPMPQEERMGVVVIPTDRMAVTVSEAARLTSLSRGTIRNYARHGRIKVVKVGRRTIVPIGTLQSLVREGLNSQ
jgi:excisionase family DNA binding protein